MSIECTTSANSTVTCLYSADRVACVSGAPHSLQNLEFGGSSVPHDPQNSPVAVSPPPPSPLGSTSVSFHRCSVMSVISPCHLRHEVLRLSYVVSFETRFPESSRIHSLPGFCAQLLHLVEHVGERSLQAQRLLDLIRRHVRVLAVLQKAGEVVLAHELHE